MHEPLIVSMKLCFFTSSHKGTYTQSECPIPRILLRGISEEWKVLTGMLGDGRSQQHDMHTLACFSYHLCLILIDGQREEYEVDNPRGRIRLTKWRPTLISAAVRAELVCQVTYTRTCMCSEIMIRSGRRYK